MTSHSMETAVAGPQPPPTRPMTGDEYLESLRDGREIWLYGERVADVTTHPGSATPRGWSRGSTTPSMIRRTRTSSPPRRIPVRMGYTHRYSGSRSAEEQLAGAMPSPPGLG